MAELKVGDRVTRSCLTLGDPKHESTDWRSNGRISELTGTVIYIHPEGRYHVVEFDHGLRESFLSTGPEVVISARERNRRKKQELYWLRRSQQQCVDCGKPLRDHKKNGELYVRCRTCRLQNYVSLDV